eukprot:CAMPEP_0114591020 /NCGR_PEP_ID=MMETSP0125-20121206/13170_1 /TAXON_ID=485358 ORGANISM="Aristerostoma sp., Strain ATCC 50986" /NCGR_SAMPLE_ID=MMETSP0125 /ASSEMBLY_ACC=CAM_ASM_000245 /LENGTH=49 /DNA_ID=CAMNT_0001788893 /DNA_START=45 /DNA_END=194 /DNA_ORIENTATION=-
MSKNKPTKKTVSLSDEEKKNKDEKAETPEKFDPNMFKDVINFNEIDVDF